MSGTPETDDLARGNHVVPTEWAQQLERERDEARDAFVIATDQMVQAQCKLRESNTERDEARDDLKHIGEYGTEEINAAVELRQKLATALVERDEARDKLSSRWQSLRDSQDEVLRFTFENRSLSQERDEARDKAERYRLEANAMMMQRDEAREKIEQQRKEIVRLNGATSHAAGTPLKIALRERDESRDCKSSLAEAGREMSNRATPESDARTYIPVFGASTVPAEFARKLERERDEAREKVRLLKGILDLLKKEAQ